MLHRQVSEKAYRGLVLKDNICGITRLLVSTLVRPLFVTCMDFVVGLRVSLSQYTIYIQGGFAGFRVRAAVEENARSQRPITAKDTLRCQELLTRGP